jgi:hypothetical protein
MIIDSPSVARELRYFSTQESKKNSHGQLKENLFLPLFNTNFISKSFKITDLTTCGERHDNLITFWHVMVLMFCIKYTKNDINNSNIAQKQLHDKI